MFLIFKGPVFIFPPSEIMKTFYDTALEYGDMVITDNANRQKQYLNTKIPSDKISVRGKGQNIFRYTRGNHNADENYVFLGCSFTFGDGLNEDQTLPYYFSKLMKFKKNVLNCGSNGRSSNLALNIVESDIINCFVNKNSRTKYFIYYMIKDHAYRNFRISFGGGDNWLYCNGKWERVKQPFGVLKKMFAGSYIFNKVFLNFIEQHNSLYYGKYLIESLNRIKKTVETKYGGKLIIIVWPDFEDRSLFVRELKKTDLDLIFLPEYFRENKKYLIENDWHPNAKSNEELAQILMNHINKKDNKN